MKNTFDYITKIIEEELIKINVKIKGLVLLEILKYKIIDRLNSNINNIILKNDFEENFEKLFENENRKINVKLKSNNLSKVNLNTEIDNDYLIICLKGNIEINLEDHKKKKNFNYKCLPMRGIVISNKSKFSLNFLLKSIILEITTEDKIFDIENQKNTTI